MPLSATRIVRYERLATPREHLGVLVEPGPERLHAVLQIRPEARFARTGLLDTTLAALRARLRERLNLSGPVVLCGHQAEFIHAGVFSKTIAAHALAGQLGGQAAYLTVDSDVPKTTQLTLPQITSGGLRRIEVTIPGCDPQYPFEAQPPASRAEWLQFFASVTSMHEFGDRSLVPTFARAWLTTESATPQYCDALARAHLATEAVLGLEGVRELRISRLCATPEFRAWAAHMLLDARRCAEQYNAALTEYREGHRVRTRGRPVPRLSISDDAIELPFWALRPDEPRRRLFVAPRGEVVELSTDNALIGGLKRTDLKRAATHQDPWPIERDGWRLRPRALALSAFARLLLADLFIHGIGGAKYDEMMEDFARAFFGVEPAPTCCVTATVRLPLPHKGVHPTDIATARHQSHDLRYNPQRHLSGVPERLLRQRWELIRRAQRLRADQPRDRASRRVVFREIRRINERILATDPWRTAAYDQRIQTLEQQWRLDQIALDREYFYALHLQSTLEELVQVVRKQLKAAVR